MGPLVAYTSEAADLLKSVNKSLSAEKRKTVKIFYRSSKSRVDGILLPANDMVAQMEENHPTMHDALFSNDMKSEEKLNKWIADLPEPMHPTFARTLHLILLAQKYLP